jgi:hypothetical protein
MTATKKGVIWTLAFGGAGLFVPALLLLRYWVFGTMFGELEVWLWPASIIFMGLEAPNTTKFDVVLFYVIALFANFLLYATVGGLIWLIAQQVLGFRRSLSITSRRD